MNPASSCGSVGNPQGLGGGMTARTAQRYGSSSTGLVSLETSQTPSDKVIITKSTRLPKMRRVLLAAAKIIQNEMQDGGFRYRVAFITTTYRPDEEWEGKQISRLMDCYRKWCGRRKIQIKGVWVLETTKAGKPHYHIALFLPRGLTPPMPDKQGWWSHGMTNATWARRPVGYLAKYASKGFKHDIPKNARIYGVYGVSRVNLSYWRAPGWLRSFSTIGDEIKRNGEWWENHSTGIAYHSPWVLDGFGPNGVVLLWIGWALNDIRFL